MLSQRSEIVAALKEKVRRLESGSHPQHGAVSSGCRALDRLLPLHGFRRGALVEWIGAEGSGSTALAAVAARESCREGGALVVVDRERIFYPPAAVGLGIDLEHAMVVCPRNQRDHDWALHQALSCPGVSAVLCWVEKLDDRTFRRWQLAAEKGGSLGLLVRPPTVVGRPSWSDVQLIVEALPGTRSSRRLRVEVARCRGGQVGGAIELEIDDETGTIEETRAVRLASKLAHPTRVQRSSGA